MNWNIVNWAFALAVVLPSLSFGVTGGVPVDPKDMAFKGVIKFTDKCSAAAVGPHTILTSAKCADEGEIIHFEHLGKAYQATITNHPAMAQTGNSIALGYLDTRFEAALLNTQPDTMWVKAPVMVTGHGCIETGENLFSKGWSTITHITRYHYVAYRPGGATLCGADHGGPLLRSIRGIKTIVGINDNADGQTVNVATRLDTPEARSFIWSWIRLHEDTWVCGFNVFCGSEGTMVPK